MRKEIFKFVIIIIIVLGFFALNHATNAQYNLNLNSILSNQSGQTAIQKQASSLSDNDVVVYWQTGSLVPPYYKGKPLPSANSVVTLSAIILKKINPSDLLFQWYEDGILQTAGSGMTSFEFTPTFGVKYSNILLKITNANTIITKSVTIPVVSPTINIYNQTDNLKVYLSDNNLYKLPASASLNLIVEPYYFSTANPLSLNYDWQFGGASIDGAKDKNIFTLNLGNQFAVSDQESLSITATDPLNFDATAKKVSFIITQ